MNLKDDGHTYFVEDGHGAITPIWVHNADLCGLPNVNKAVNTGIVHASEQAVERRVMPDVKAAAEALRNLSKSITANGLPTGTVLDPRRADSVLVPFGVGKAVYEVTKKGTAILRTVLGAA